MKTKLLFNNTYKSGTATVFIYGNKKKYTAVCLEFGLAISASSMEKAVECIKDTTETYFKNIIEHKLSETLLNRPAEQKYWKMYTFISEVMNRRKKMQAIQSPSQIPPFSLEMLGYRNGSFITA